MKQFIWFYSFLALACSSGMENHDTSIDLPSDIPQESEEVIDIVDTSEPTSCTSNEDCDDHIDCTRDLCGVDGTCRHVADDSLCPEDQTCSTTLGCTAAGVCETNADCSDGVFCNGDERCYEGACWPGEERNCDDGNPCTNDSCNVAADRCVYEWVPECSTDAETDADLPDPFDPLVHYSGTFRLYPVVSSDCGACSFTIEFIQFTRTDTELTAQAGAFPLQQSPAPDGPSFLALYSTASAVYQLQGTFYNADEFGGRWVASFSGGCSSCSPQDFDVYGVRR
jgi:hypothetical protein